MPVHDSLLNSHGFMTIGGRLLHPMLMALPGKPTAPMGPVIHDASSRPTLSGLDASFT